MGSVRWVALALVAAVACSSGPATPADIDRFPGIEGVVTDASPASVVIDGQNTPLAAEVYSFTTASHDPVAITAMRARYAVAGLNEEGEIEWIASIGLVSGGKVYYSGTYRTTEQGRAVFEDGTTLALGPGVETPQKGTAVTIALDVATKSIVEMRV